MGRVRIAVCLAGFLACAAAPGFAAPFTNGSFESGISPGTFITLGSGDSSSITGWTAGSIDYIGSYWTAADGSRSLDLNGFDPGGIEQTFDTIANTFYTITFAMAGNTDSGPALKTLDAYIDGVLAGSFSFNTSGKTKSNMGWTDQTFGFTAAAGATTLKFVSTTTGLSGNQTYPYAFGPALDNVRLTADESFQILRVDPIPEPASMLLLGSGLIAGARRMRRRSL